MVLEALSHSGTVLGPVILKWDKVYLNEDMTFHKCSISHYFAVMGELFCFIP